MKFILVQEVMRRKYEKVCLFRKNKMGAGTVYNSLIVKLINWFKEIGGDLYETDAKKRFSSGDGVCSANR